MAKGKPRHRTTWKQYMVLLLGGLLGGYIALYLNEAKNINPAWDNIGSMTWLLLMVLILGYFAFWQLREGDYR